jgi:hypothetical protein
MSCVAQERAAPVFHSRVLGTAYIGAISMYDACKRMTRQKARYDLMTCALRTVRPAPGRSWAKDTCGPADSLPLVSWQMPFGPETRGNRPVGFVTDRDVIVAAC